MENKNYGEIFCQATEILAQHLIEQVSFDRTILCSIIDDTEKDIGKYKVSNNEATFDAYANDTKYKNGDNIYVSIPSGDWNEQKLIVSKKATESEPIVEYIDPYDSFVNITNNIIPTNSLTVGLTANDINKGQILLWSYNSTEDSLLKNNGNYFVGYNRLAISASFQTLLKSLNVRFGDYGLNLIVETMSADSNDTATKVCRLNCSDMFGNPYNYESFFPVNKVFDISNINKITKMELWFFQKEGSFLDIEGNLIPYKNINNENLPNNIFVKDINVSLGYDASQFNNDTLILYTQDSTSYDQNKEPQQDNHKKIEIRWIHKFENGIVKTVEEDDGIDYSLTFYRHSLGEKSDTVWSGVDWAPLSRQIVNNGKTKFEVLDADLNEYNNKVSDVLNTPFKLLSYNTTWLIPNYNKAEEKLKAIVSYNNEIIYSDILIISNAKEVISTTTMNAMQALSIGCEDKTEGNYFIYRIDGKILDTAESNKQRWFKLYFNTMIDSEENAELVEAESIEWIVPSKNTMINLLSDDKINLDEEGYYHIIKIGDEVTNFIKDRNSLCYKINSSYHLDNTNNTIKCIIVRNGIIYIATKELSFGQAGTAGTDYTFVLEFAENQNALTIGNDGLGGIDVIPTLYDYSGKEIEDFRTKNEVSIEWSIINEKYMSINTEQADKNKVNIRLKNNLTEVPEDNFAILKASLKGWGDFTLEAYLPIPIRSSKDYQFITGATYIRYNSLGYLEDIFGNPYAIYKNNGIESIDGIWSIKSGIINDPYIPIISASNGKYTLRPINSYIDNAMTQLCVVGRIGENKVWSQPIYVYQNKYPTSIVNEWNGKFEIKKEKNAILAAKVIAGKKNDDNTFSGVMMGSWDGVDNAEGVLKENTGIYGFQEGVSTFGFRDDGTAFIGKPNAGRLEFDGNKSTIQSNLMASANNGGMKLDFDDGYIQLKQPNSKNNEIWIDAQKGVEKPVRIGSKFKVAWDGSLEAVNGTFQGNIDADSGDIGAWHLIPTDAENNVGALHTKKTWLYPNGKITVGGEDSDRNESTPPENPPFIVEPDGKLYAKGMTLDGGNIIIKSGNDKIFQVDDDGHLTSTSAEITGKIEAGSGKIGKWEIDDNGALYNKNTYLLQDGSIYSGGLKNPKFKVDSEGNLYAESANITGGSISITDRNKTIFEANNDGFNLANGNFIYNKDEDTLRLKDVVITWRDEEENKEIDLNDYLDTLQSQTNNIQDQLDKRAQTWYQATDPSNDWKDNDTKELHLGDLWHCTVSIGDKPKNSEWVWVKKKDNSYEWQKIEVSDEVFDKIDGVASIFTTIPDNPVVGDLLIPTEDIKDGNVIKYYAKKVYKYTYINEKFEWIEINYTDDTNLNNFIANEFDTVKRNGELLIDELGFQKTEIGESYIISPSIGGGYLNIVGATNGSKVIIDPNGIDPNNDKGYIFLINNGTTNTLMIDNQGNANFEGSITMNSGTISWDKVADNGAYSLASSASSSASTALDDILDLAKGEYTKGGKTFINGRGIYSPTIVGGKLYATDDFPEDGTNATDYTEITKEGLKICRDNSEGIIVPKFEILVGRENYSSLGYENTIRIAIGAGEITDQGAAGGWADRGRLILEKDETNTGKIYIKGGTDQYSGIIFNYNKLSFFDGSTIDFTGCEVIGLEGVEGGIAVFG